MDLGMTLNLNTPTPVTLYNVNNPVYLPLAGVPLRGYAIRDRIVVGIYNYAPIVPP